jgi:glycolate oxidase
MAAQFNPVTPELLAELRQVVGDKYVKTDEDYLERYQTDEEGNSHYFHKPEVVVFPGSTEEVVAIVKLANKYLVRLRRARLVPVLPVVLFLFITAWSSNWNG